jgi:hypothetical protein
MAVRYDRCVLCESILPAMNMQPTCGRSVYIRYESVGE